jgi:hypothetical protein
MNYYLFQLAEILHHCSNLLYHLRNVSTQLISTIQRIADTEQKEDFYVIVGKVSGRFFEGWRYNK